MEVRGSWSSMEEDCLVEIFARIGIEDLILSVPFVCKPWLEAARRPLCWKRLNFRQADLLPWSQFSKSFSLRYSLPYSFSILLKLTLHRSRRSAIELRFPIKFTSIEHLVMASVECPNLKHVAIPKMSSSEEIEFPELISKWEDLEKLELGSMLSNFAQLAKSISLSCNQFSWLVVAGGSLRKEDALCIAKYMPKLKNLDLRNTYLSKEQLLIILEGCRELQKLNLVSCIGFDGEDKDIQTAASRIKGFMVEGSKLSYENYYESITDRSSKVWLYGYAV